MKKTKVKNLSEKKITEVIRIFEENNGVLRTKEALDHGIAPLTLYTMRDHGIITALSRGVYAIADREIQTNIDAIAVVKRVPRAVICLISALDIHGITLQIPHSVHIALPKQMPVPRIDYPPVSVVRMTKDSYEAGRITVPTGDMDLPVYDVEKTIADCFKYRKKLTLDIALEALKMYKRQKRVKVDELLKYAKICRVEKIMRRYLEAIL